MEKRIPNVSIENASFIFRNFAGKESRFNKAGARNFGVLLADDLAEAMASDGWNVKHLPPREPGDPEQAWIPVSVAFGSIPPKVILVTSGGYTRLDEDTINQLDYAEIENVDIIIRPYCWEVNGNTGVKAYVKTMYVTVCEDDFGGKYKMGGHDEDDMEVPF